MKVFLTGCPGVGKTTIVKKVREAVDHPICGFYSEEFRESGQRIGFNIVDAKTNKTTVLASSKNNFRGPTVAKYTG